MTPIELYKSDFYRISGTRLSYVSFLKKIGNVTSWFCLWFRLCTSPNPLIAKFANFMRWRMVRRHHLQIPRNTRIGPGFFIAHAMCVVMHPNTVIGKNCTIHQFLTIGGRNGKAPIIGDNVFIGASVTLLGDIHIGNNVTIGAGAVVVSDIPDNATAVGNPAKVVSTDNPGKFQQNLWV